MNGFRFYLEFHGPRAKKRSGRHHYGHSGNVVAIQPETLAERMDGKMDAVGAVHFHPDGQCASTSASIDYIREKCKRIPERLVRKIHPALFTYLDQEESA